MAGDPVSDTVRIGGYALEVGTNSGSFARFSPKREKENAQALTAALAAPDEEQALVTQVEQLESSATAVTSRIEQAHGLLRAAAEGRLLDRDALMSEIDGLLALSKRLDRDGRYEEQLRLARALHGLLALTFRWLDLVRSLRRVLSGARRAKDTAGEAWALHELGSLHLCAGQPKAAERHFREALGLEDGLGAAAACSARHNLEWARRDTAAGRLRVLLGVAASSVTAVALMVVLVVSGVTTAAVVPQVAELGPDQLSFRDQSVGQTSAPRTVWIRAGSKPIRLQGISSSRPAEFPVKSNCPPSLSPGEQCTVDVRFRPEADGRRTARLEVEVARGDDLRAGLAGFGIDTPVVGASLDPPSLTFGEVVLGERSAPAELRLTAGSDELRIRGIATQASEFPVDQACPATLAPGTSCAIHVSFVPVADGRRAATLVVARAQEPPLTSALAGTGREPPLPLAARLTPSTLWLGEARIGGAPAVQALTLHAGSEPLGIAGIATGSEEFGVDEDCPEELAPDASCAIDVAFRPVAPGRREATLRVERREGVALTSALAGHGSTVPQPVLAPSEVRFDEVELGDRSPPHELTLSAGPEPLRVRAIESSSSEFTVADHCPDVLAPLTSCTLEVVFAPRALGRRGGALEVSRAGGAALTTALIGFGKTRTEPVLAPRTLDFGEVETGERSARRELILTAGSDDLPVEIATGSNEFLVDHHCTDPLARGTSCRIAVVFAPTRAGRSEATLRVTSEAGREELTSGLAGTGTTATPAELTPGSLDLGEVELGDRLSGELTLTAGSEELRIQGIETRSREFRSAWYCPEVLPPGKRCTISITFLPAEDGRREARLVVDAASGETLSAALTGTGLEPPRVRPSRVAFGNVEVGLRRLVRVRLTAGSKPLAGIETRTDDAKRFPATTTCGSELGPGATCVVTVAFRPLAAGFRSARLSVELADREPLVVPLTGTGIEAVIELDPRALDLGSVTSDSPDSASAVVTIANTGTAPLVIEDITSSSRFFSVKSACPASLGPEQSCRFTVTFSTGAVGRHTATISVHANGRGPHALVATGEGVVG